MGLPLVVTDEDWSGRTFGLDEEKRLLIVSVCAPRVGERRVRERGGRGGARSMEEWTAEKGKIEWRGTLRTGGRGGGEKEDRKEGAVRKK